MSWIRQIVPSERVEVERRLCRCAVRQLATVQAYGAAVVHAPTLDERICALERAREELERLEQVADVFRELFEGDLLTAVRDEVARLTTPCSWLEACAAQLALSIAARIDFGRQNALPGPFAEVTREALAQETEHVAAARAALFDLAELQAGSAEEAARCLKRWLQVGLETLDADETRSAYLAELESEVRSSGLCAADAPLYAYCH